MTLEARHHNQFSPQIITNNREFVKHDDAKLNNFVPMGCANPFPTMENPWLGLNHQFLGMNNMNFVKPESGLSNNMPNGPKNRSRDSIEDQFNNFNMPPIANNVPIQDFAPQSNFRFDVQHLRSRDDILSQFNKNIKLVFEAQHERDLKFLLASVTSKFVKRLRIQSEQISRMGKLNMALQERMKSLYAETQVWKDVANTAEPCLSVKILKTSWARLASCTGQLMLWRLKKMQSLVVEVLIPERIIINKSDRVVEEIRVLSMGRGCVKNAGKENQVFWCCRAGIFAYAMFAGAVFNLPARSVTLA